MEGYCKKCKKKVDIRELYEIVMFTKDRTSTFRERDCKECREVIKKGEKVST